jgi:hypothetical protein
MVELVVCLNGRLLTTRVAGESVAEFVYNTEQSRGKMHGNGVSHVIDDSERSSLQVEKLMLDGRKRVDDAPLAR